MTLKGGVSPEIARFLGKFCPHRGLYAIFLIPKTMSNTMPKPMCNEDFRLSFVMDDGYKYFPE